jgi:hypothetical protein
LVISRRSSFTGGGRPQVLFRALFQARDAIITGICVNVIFVESIKKMINEVGISMKGAFRKLPCSGLS